MPEQDPQARMNEQLNLPGMGSDLGRYSNDPQIPEGKSMFDVVAQQDEIRKNAGDYNEYLKEHERLTKRIARLEQIRLKQGATFLAQQREVLKMDSQKLKQEIQSHKILQDRKGLQQDLAALDKEGYKNLNAAAKLRIKEYQDSLAQARALEKEQINSGDIPHAISGMSTRDLIERTGPVGARHRLGVWASRTWLGRQLGETASAARGVSLTNPSSLMGLVRANPIVSGVLAAGYAARGFNEGRGLYIPGVGTVPGTDIQTYMNLGHTTGEGYGAGLAARAESFRLGLNPFDTITSQVAGEIVQGVRGQGFRGARARTYESTVASVYKDLGIDVNTITAMAEIFARRGRLDEFRTSMENLDKIAKDTGTSVQAVADQLKNLQDTLIGGGGIQNAPLAQGILGATNRAFPNLTAQQRSSIQQFTVQGMSAFTGLPEQVAQTPYGAQLGLRMMRPMLHMFSQQFASLGPMTGNPSPQQQLLIGTLRASIPGFQGMDYPTVLHVLRNPGYLDRVQHSTSRFQVHSAFEAASGAMHRQESRVRDFTRRASEGFLTHDEVMSAHFTDSRQVYVNSLERNLRGIGIRGQRLSSIIDPLQAAAAGHGDWGRTLSHAGELARKYSDKQDTQKGQITLRLDGPETKKLLSGKGVSKSVDLEKAFHGVAKYTGLNNVPGF